MPTAPISITTPDALDALRRSGYLLETKVERVLRSRGYYVEANSPYTDPDTAKSRELDVYAMAASHAGPEKFDFTFSVLLIECVNNPQPLVLITKDPLVPHLQHEDLRMAGLPVKILRGTESEGWDRLSDYLDMGKWHHYSRGRYATQFCSFVWKQQNGPWMAIHEGPHFDAFKKLGDAVDYFSRRHFESWVLGPRENVNLELYYPVLVVQGDLMEARLGRRDVRLSRSQHLRFRRSVVIGRSTEMNYQIDVVTERAFPRLVRLIDEELTRTARLLRRRHRIVRRAIERIVLKAKRFRTPEKIAAAMDF